MGGRKWGAPLGLNEHLSNVQTWLNANIITLNVCKKYFKMLIGSGQRLNTTNGTRLKQVTTTKSFGVTIDDKRSLFQAFR